VLVAGERRVSTMKALPVTAVLRVVGMTALTLTVAAPPPSSAGNGDAIPFDEARLFFELNNTDGDLGIHAEIDGEDWKRLTIKTPDRRRAVLEVQTAGSLRQQGLTELRFESAEPPFEEQPPEEFFDRFPEGVYEIKGRTLEGDELRSEVPITHVMPAPPTFTQPPLAPCDDPVMVAAPVTIAWLPVNTSHPDLGVPGVVDVEHYELAIERADLGLDFFMQLPPSVTSFPVPALFTDVPGVVKFEVLVRARDGNRTAEESCFEIPAP
jgi:hypothetical protein